MSSIAEKFVALNKKQLETGVQAIQIGFVAWESLVRLNVEAAKSLVQEGLASVQSLTSVRDPAGFSVWTSGQLQSGVERISGYGRNVYEITGAAAGQVGNLLEQTLLSNTQEAAEWVDEVLKATSTPQPEATAAAAKAAMANAKTIIEGISKAVRQTAGFADANVRAAVAATAEAVKKTAG
ncbi:MAG TPA: phasin family protein [Burkholderiales bacterium]|nr:phasin family protein [Burkholderiales bacterium]